MQCFDRPQINNVSMTNATTPVGVSPSVQPLLSPPLTYAPIHSVQSAPAWAHV